MKVVIIGGGQPRDEVAGGSAMDESRSLQHQMFQEQTLQQVSCQVCRHEVPLSEAVVPEAVDYMVYLCGLDCYAAWKARARAFGNADS